MSTALERYVRLEALAEWRCAPEAAPREVVVSFGQASLVLRDPTDRPLAHWALAGMRILDRRGDATVYSTTEDGFETLAIRDREMIAAIRAVTAAERFPKPPPPPRKRRRWLPIAVLAAALGLAAYFLPERLPPAIARLVPPETAELLGDEILLRIADAAGGLCAEPAGRAALAGLAARLAPDAPPRLQVAGLGDAGVRALPGGLVVLDRDLLARAAGPEEVAGWIALGLAADAARPATERLIAESGPVAGARYLFTGRLGEAALDRAARRAGERAPFGPAVIAGAARRLEQAGLGTEALAEGLRREGRAAEAALLPAGSRDAAAPALADPDWLALRGVCG